MRNVCVEKLLASQQQRSTSSVNQSRSLILPFSMAWLKQTCSVAAMPKTRFLAEIAFGLSALALFKIQPALSLWSVRRDVGEFVITACTVSEFASIFLMCCMVKVVPLFLPDT
jgi:hypothetical protein